MIRLDKSITFDKRTIEEKEHMIDAVKSFSMWFEAEFKLSTYLIYGSLVGAFRNQKFIGYDYDIDLAYLSNESNIEEVKKENTNIVEALKHVKLLYVAFKDGHMHVKSLDKEVIFDFWPSWIINNKYYVCGAYNGELNKNDVLPLTSCVFENRNFNIPNNSDKVLSNYYGDWKTPNGNVYTWTPVKKWVTLA